MTLRLHGCGYLTGPKGIRAGNDDLVRVSRMHLFVDEPNHAFEFRARPRLTGLFRL